MRKFLCFILFIFSGLQSIAQKQSFDLVTYIPPKGWTKEVKAGVVVYTYIDKKDKSWCQLGIYKSTVSKGSLEADFNSEWETLVEKQYHPTEPPTGLDSSEAEGWKIRSGAGRFMFAKKETAVLLTTFSGYGVCLSIIATTPNRRYFDNVTALMSTLELQQPARQQQTNTGVTSSSNAAYTFSKTNFDDGWTSVIKDDWVEVTRNNITVLLHYPNPATVFAADPDPLTRAAWNILVAPRYSKLKNFKTTYISNFERVYMGFGTATRNDNGKEVFVVLFRQAGNWLEFIVADKNRFIQQFKVDPETIFHNSDAEVVKPLLLMANYNKFAIAAPDFTGNWKDRFSSNTYYTNVYTGNSAGMSTYSSSQSFEFSGNRYKWQLVAVNSYGGQSAFGQGKGNGVFKVLNNWQISFSDMEGKPKTYDAYFSAVKNGRILWMNDAQYPGNGIYTGFSKQ